MKWMTADGHLIEETVVKAGPERPARVLRVTRQERAVGQYACWADLIVNIDVRRMTEVE
ncbi:hypothetical protein ThrDRAFT_03508 [Frankia casuarinae]|jgi:hypothetical protein|uniref:hypothetical protein n=2 Tax=Frankiaceae TaxID=74712 RepID=UPI0002EF16B7|nr:MULTISPECIES: hypothetical protein [Frankia]ETA00010.1 hypothetical protein CcI6DRAFT_04583 [Frankia sp. CcI6]EYT90860.1 hypothetical protein ThrDRAFT_03508 [Frankia casuarinae]KDA41854.1 hypothetical protein BMG523Draft_03325 [Frankia sp. BMG5.23]KEZ35363.1 hypothetical protein CEDDRAFT_03294 [Frankia sp. CeD]KFB02755.1 hypothetical protein ALLO2DRAFT_04505 [Frankia sp. Allo2]